MDVGWHFDWAVPAESDKLIVRSQKLVLVGALEHKAAKLHACPLTPPQPWMKKKLAHVEVLRKHPVKTMGVY